MSHLECQIYRGADDAWDEFVSRQSSGTFFHLARWRRILEESFGFEPQYLCAVGPDGVRGVLPLFLVKSAIFGRSLVSVPISVYGGPVGLDDEAIHALLQAAMRLAREREVRYLEVRGNPHSKFEVADILNGSTADWSRKDLYFTFLCEIEPTEDANLARIPRKQRRMVRQGDKHGLKACFDKNRLSEFYDVYAESVRNLGTPVYAYSYFKSLVSAFEHQCNVLVIEYRNRIIAGVFSFLFRDQVLPFYGGALREYLHLAPNDFMYWQLMRFAAEQGYKVFDFGRSKDGSGPYHFKRHWGFEPQALPYWYYAPRGKVAPDTSSLNPKLQWAIRMWRGLPLGVTKIIGPHIVRHIP